MPIYILSVKNKCFDTPKMVYTLLLLVWAFPNTKCFKTPGVSKHCSLKTPGVWKHLGFQTPKLVIAVSTVFGTTVYTWYFNIFVKTPIVFTCTGYQMLYHIVIVLHETISENNSILCIPYTSIYIIRQRSKLFQYIQLTDIKHIHNNMPSFVSTDIIDIQLQHKQNDSPVKFIQLLNTIT